MCNTLLFTSATTTFFNLSNIKTSSVLDTMLSTRDTKVSSTGILCGGSLQSNGGGIPESRGTW